MSTEFALNTQSLTGLQDSLGPTGGPASAVGAPSQFDVAAFRQALADPAARPAAAGASTIDSGLAAGQLPSGSGFRTVVSMLEKLNGDVRSINAEIAPFMDGSQDMSPSDMLMLTVRCHEFLFHSQLTANAANRTSDGVQQLFRQQS